MNPAAAFLGRLEQAAWRATVRSSGAAMTWRGWGRGPALVLLHGASGSWRHWARNIDRLAASHRLLVPDLPGMGDSEKPDGLLDRPRMARMIVEAMDQLLGGERCDLAGFSLGGSIAGLVAGLAPGRIRSLTLVGGSGFGGPVRTLRTVRISGLEGAARVAAHRENLHTLMIADPARIDPLALEIQEQNTRTRRVKLPDDRGTPFLPAGFGDFEGPLNAAWGERDQFALDLPGRIARLRDARPAADIRLFPDAGHWVAYEAAEAFDAYLLSRLADGRQSDD